MRLTPSLAGVRHLLVSDLTGEELAVVRAASPHLAGLLDEASPRLRELLANPFNLDLAGQLISEGGVSILQVHTRAELLAEYWRRRIGQGPSAVGQDAHPARCRPPDALRRRAASGQPA